VTVPSWRFVTRTPSKDPFADKHDTTREEVIRMADKKTCPFRNGDYCESNCAFFHDNQCDLASLCRRLDAKFEGEVSDDAKEDKIRRVLLRKSVVKE
jgi:hypothetical protein